MLAALAALTVARDASALRLMDYNILNYPGSSGATRDPLYRTIISPISPDVLITEEMTSQAGVTEFLGSLNTMEPGQWAAAPFLDGNDTDSGLFYKPSKVQFLGQWGFYPNPANHLRLVHVYRLLPVGYTTGASEFRLYAVHLKASTGSTNVAQRLAEATGMRDSMNAVPPGTHCMAVGDFNFYNGSEPGFTKFLEFQVDSDGQLYDPLGLSGIAWQDNASIAIKHTQSPCLSGGVACASGASTGGLDDRFDLILPTLNWNDGTGYELVPNSYISVGNDGQHLNKNITDSPTIPEGASYANALIFASDHLPVRVDLSLPAILVAGSTLDLGTVIESGSADFPISNGATAPADGLTCSFTPTSGFATPPSAEIAPGSGTTIPVSTTVGPFGPRSGTLAISSDALDDPSHFVSLSANVLDHAAPSLDSTAIVIEDSLVFVTTAGNFTPLDARVHNAGYSSTRARLQVDGGTISGPDATHFALVSSGPALLADVGQTYEVEFQEGSADPDKVYTAQLVIGTADEALPGGTARPNVTLDLRGMLVSHTNATPGEALPQFSRLLSPYPNPFARSSVVRFDVAKHGRVNVSVFDLSGRKVATLADRAFEPGHYAEHWNGADASGVPVGPGVYFVRMTGPGMSPAAARIAVIR